MPLFDSSGCPTVGRDFVTVILKKGVANPQIATALGCGYIAMDAFSTKDVDFNGLAKRFNATTLEIREDLLPKISGLRISSI